MIALNIATAAPSGRTPQINTTGEMLRRRTIATATTTSTAEAITVDQFWLTPHLIRMSRKHRPVNPHAKQAISARGGVVRITPNPAAKTAAHRLFSTIVETFSALLGHDRVGQRNADRQDREQEHCVDDPLDSH